jgi:hypothetical protein
MALTRKQEDKIFDTYSRQIEQSQDKYHDMIWEIARNATWMLYPNMNEDSVEFERIQFEIIKLIKN